MIRRPDTIFKGAAAGLSALADPDPVPAQVKDERAKTEPDKPEPDLHVPQRSGKRKRLTGSKTSEKMIQNPILRMNRLLFMEGSGHGVKRGNRSPGSVLLTPFPAGTAGSL